MPQSVLHGYIHKDIHADMAGGKVAIDVAIPSMLRYDHIER